MGNSKMEPWLANYLHLRPRQYADRDFYKGQIFWLAVIARSISALIDREKIAGNARLERLCRWALATIKRTADFTLLDPGGSEYLRQIRNAQKRLEGILRT